ncbi:divalent-cation tolerance protein CutA [Nonomuraea longispora]|uniref:divalent-cation tolerance protein CutA n=1 Tax=Nonomuraea longispora TaxID=1848320 RepID=UPI001FE30D6F|nr:divalent-cation tolerance protein CutA [Nonomuraea longispora]
MIGVAECLEVHVTVPDRDLAERIAAVVVAERPVAAAQLVAPITSVYWWRGEINRADEWLLFMKTTGERFDELAAAIRRMHPYEVPQIVAVPLVAGTADYLEWIRRETTPEPGA